ncbi:MAG TPA: DUF2490 domain-containing protein [Bryobacteraceae bacterium]|nr:DUF2490 domain-containing protein [Bryobacteraceae bacterium]
MQKFALLVFISIPLLAQPDVIDFNQNGWFSYSGDHRVAGRWGIHFDAQWRRAQIITRWQQYQFRPGVNFQANRNLLLTVGYAFTRTYPYGDFPGPGAFPEHRIYQQAVIRHPRTSVNISQRFRLEQRFIESPNSSNPRSTTYSNRFRYMFRAELPLARNGDSEKTWYLPVWDEILLGIPPNMGARTFDHNRLFVGIGRALGAGNIELGYMNQFVGQKNGQIFEFNNTLFVTFTSTFDLSQLWR